MTLKEQQGIPHHLLGTINAVEIETFNSQMFVEKSLPIVRKHILEKILILNPPFLKQTSDIRYQ